MKHDDLPERWKLKIIEYLRKNGETETNKLNANNFFSNQI